MIPVVLSLLFGSKFPVEPGCCSILREIKLGPPLAVSENAPAALHGCKWPDVRTWTVLVWQNGVGFCATLKTETPAPWTLEGLPQHHLRYPECWRLVAHGCTPEKN